MATNGVLAGTNSLSVSNLLSSSPAQHAPDYVNRAIIFGVIAIVVVGFPLLLGRGKLVALKRHKETFHYFFELAEWILAIAISVEPALFGIFKPESWETPKSSMVGGVALWGGLVTCFLFVKGVSAAAKKKDSEEIQALKQEKSNLEEQVNMASSKAAVLEEQRDKVLDVTTYVRKIVDSKMTRLVKFLQGKQKLQVEDLMHALDPVGQLSTIFSVIFVYFEKSKKPEAQLRLALYSRDPQDRNALKRIYGWDGKTRECFQRGGDELGRLDDPEGAKTQLVKMFHSADTINIIESCEKASKAGAFQYFPGQQTYLRSMVLYKHIFEHNGTKDAIILTLDSSEDGLFREKDEQELRIFLLEMMKRVEFELRFLETLTAATKC